MNQNITSKLAQIVGVLLGTGFVAFLFSAMGSGPSIGMGVVTIIGILRVLKEKQPPVKVDTSREVK